MLHATATQCCCNCASAAIVPPQAQVVDAPNLPEAEASYVINADGIGDYKVGCGTGKTGACLFRVDGR